MDSGEHDVEEISGGDRARGYNPLAPTSGTACVKSLNTRKRKGKPGRKLPVGANRLYRQLFCHSCRRLSKLSVLCSDCPLHFCERCLAVRHGENVHEVSNPEIKWLCPRCRRGCGRGCERICCTCSSCCRKHKRIPPVGMMEGRRRINEATSAGWNLHDYLIHLQTNESKLEIANRKLSHGWAGKASGNTIMHPNVINKGTDHLPSKGAVAKRRTTGDRSDDEGITERVEKCMHIDEKTRRTTLYSAKEIESTMERATGQSNQPGHYYVTRQTTRHQIAEAIQIKEMDLNTINENHARPADRPRKSAEKDDIDTSYEALCNSLIPYSDIASNTYLMSLWFNKAKDLTGNQMSITLTDGEMQVKNGIKNRSHAGQIADEFRPAKLKNLPRNEQESMKQKLGDHLKLELAEYVKKRLPQFYKEVGKQMTRDFLKAKGDIDLAIERMKSVIESKGISKPDFIQHGRAEAPTK